MQVHFWAVALSPVTESLSFAKPRKNARLLRRRDILGPSRRKLDFARGAAVVVGVLAAPLARGSSAADSLGAAVTGVVTQPPPLGCRRLCPRKFVRNLSKMNVLNWRRKRTKRRRQKKIARAEKEGGGGELG